MHAYNQYIHAVSNDFKCGSSLGDVTEYSFTTSDKHKLSVYGLIIFRFPFDQFSKKRETMIASHQPFLVILGVMVILLTAPGEPAFIHLSPPSVTAPGACRAITVTTTTVTQTYLTTITRTMETQFRQYATQISPSSPTETPLTYPTVFHVPCLCDPCHYLVTSNPCHCEKNINDLNCYPPS